MDVIKGNQVKEYFTKEILKASKRHNVNLSDETKIYVIRLLTGLIKPQKKLWEEEIKPSKNDSITLMYKSCIEEDIKTLKEERYQLLGDKCLIQTGLFYENVRQHGRSYVNFHIDLGSNAYMKLFYSRGNPYNELGEKFSDLSNVIADLRLPELKKEDNLYQIIKKFKETNDQRYASLLISKGIIFPKKTQS